MRKRDKLKNIELANKKLLGESMEQAASIEPIIDEISSLVKTLESKVEDMGVEQSSRLHNTFIDLERCLDAIFDEIHSNTDLKVNDSDNYGEEGWGGYLRRTGISK